MIGDKPAPILFPVNPSALLDPESLQLGRNRHLPLRVYLGASHSRFFQLAQAQTETVLYNFTGGSDGNDPFSGLTSDGAGNFYGTTVEGGRSGDGAVFELSPHRSGGWKETAIYSFTGG